MGLFLTSFGVGGLLLLPVCLVIIGQCIGRDAPEMRILKAGAYGTVFGGLLLGLCVGVLVMPGQFEDVIRFIIWGTLGGAVLGFFVTTYVAAIARAINTVEQ